MNCVSVCSLQFISFITVTGHQNQNLTKWIYIQAFIPKGLDFNGLTIHCVDITVIKME